LKTTKMLVFLVFQMISVFFINFLRVLATTGDIGFTANLIHRDSPLSPFYNSFETYTDRMKNTLLNYGIGEYYLNYSIGTPKVKQSGIIDTGSDIIWTQCRPCSVDRKECFKQDAVIFDPKGLEKGAHGSSTYKGVSYDSPYCKALGDQGKFRVRPYLCGYQLKYTEGTTSKGDLAEESFAIGDSISLQGIVFGCGHRNKGEGYEHYATGVIGLGDSQLSLIYQLPIKRKFSYCLVDRSRRETTSKINFGSVGLDTKSSAVVSTPLVKPKASPTSSHYHITLIKIDMGGRAQLNYNDSTIPPLGNMIVDVASTYSYIHHQLFDSLKAKMERAVGYKAEKDLWEKGRICFKARKRFLPSITFHFDGGMKLTLPPENSYFTVSQKKNIECLTILGNEDPKDEAVFGVSGQANFVVGYDLELKRIFFMEKDCTEY
ncbi:hypothetical protein Dsin_025093, partial [Dipteronia sinensis]